ncbi:rhodanese-like domain-containing protein [Spirulina sp. CCNP1310]|uniref:rhodanese-like domain-containing protein n=1 Tax=Spirulina sp. CCNP1310 TaxID=3110249 RepID=UPI002B2155D7|nr:rhodanese-like domain-containing protein [Spirulina sp. CCNP1310]MEA5418148.1 rhodanese-like domain-containing protein [Spirulina sp. CCNP1310]
MHSHSDRIPSISVTELAQRLAQGDPDLQLIDVREPEEVAIAHLPNFKIYPLSQFGQWSTTLPTTLKPDAETYVLCHHGVRSAQMCQWLRSQGFTNVTNIQGGIEAYASLVDGAIARY